MGLIDEEEFEENQIVHEIKTDTVELAVEEETKKEPSALKPAFAGLPMDSSADDWMSEDVCEMIDDDEDKKVEKLEVASNESQIEKETQKIPSIKNSKPGKPVKPARGPSKTIEKNGKPKSEDEGQPKIVEIDDGEELKILES